MTSDNLRRDATTEPSDPAAPPQPSHSAAPPQPSHSAAPHQPSHSAAPPQPSQSAAPPQPSDPAAPHQPSDAAARANAEYDNLVNKEGSSLSKFAKIGGAVALVAMIGFWGWAFLRGPGVPHKDELVSVETRERYVDYSGDTPVIRDQPPLDEASPDDHASIEFIVGAEELCSYMNQAISDLDSANSVETPQDRAYLVEQGSEIVAGTLAEIELLPRPNDPEKARIIGEWINDYYLYVDDRLAYSYELLDGDDGPFTVSASNYSDERVTDLLSTFAEVNAMYSCVPPSDV